MVAQTVLPEFDEGKLWSQISTCPQIQKALPTVSPSELRILAALASGRSYREIATRRGFRPKTVKNKGLVLLKKVSPSAPGSGCFRFSTRGAGAGLLCGG